VGLERGPLSLVCTTEELLERKSSGSGREAFFLQENIVHYGIQFAIDCLCVLFVGDGLGRRLWQIFAVLPHSLRDIKTTEMSVTVSACVLYPIVSVITSENINVAVFCTIRSAKQEVTTQ
jgi:hypothetical protein